MKSFSVLQFVRPKSSGVEFDRLSANPSLTATKKKAPPNLELSGLRLFCVRPGLFLRRHYCNTILNRKSTHK